MKYLTVFIIEIIYLSLTQQNKNCLKKIVTPIIKNQETPLMFIKINEENKLI